MIATVNNKAPEFNNEQYSLVNVSRTLPGGLNLDILNLYNIDAWLQDIDRDNSGNQETDDISLTISGKEKSLISCLLLGFFRRF